MKKVVGLLVLLVFVQQLATAQKNEITWYSFEEAIEKTTKNGFSGCLHRLVWLVQKNG